MANLQLNLVLLPVRIIPGSLALLHLSNLGSRGLLQLLDILLALREHLQWVPQLHLGTNCHFPCRNDSQLCNNICGSWRQYFRGRASSASFVTASFSCLLIQ